MATFALTGDADSIRSSATRWSSFSVDAGTAAGDIRGIDSGDFQGDEAETFRHKLNQDLPPHLDSTAQAWSTVATALTTYAAALADLQSRMTALASTAAHQQDTVAAAGSAAADAQTADARHAAAQLAATTALPPGRPTPPDPYHSQSPDAAGRLSTANAALQSTIDAANQLRSDHDRAVQHCVSVINQAAGTRFQEPPGFWGRLTSSFTSWVSQHADVLKSISSVLKTISGIAGVLAMIPVLAPVMGPIALVAGGGALLIDTTVKVVTGQGSWGGILFDAATMLPLAKGMALLRGTTAGTSVARVASAAGNALRDTKIVGSAEYALAAVRNRGTYEGGRLLAGAKNVMRRVEVEIPLGQRSLASSAGSLAMTQKAQVPAIFTHRAAAEFKKGMDERVYEIHVSNDKYPDSALHIRDAQRGQIWSGHTVEPGVARSDVLTIDRQGAAERRRQWQSARTDVGPLPGKDRDEYPPAMFLEGGHDAAGRTPSLKYIDSADNRGAGSTMGHDLRRGWSDYSGAGLPTGARVRIRVR